MRISELSERTGVSIPTLKYYLREDLLMPGTPTSATRAEYDAEHVDRVRLIRALIHAVGLSIASTRRVVSALGPNSDGEAITRAHTALPFPSASEAELFDADQLLRTLKWRTGPTNPGRDALGVALSAAATVGLNLSQEDLRRYATAAIDIAGVDLAAAFSVPDLHMTRNTLILRTVLMDPILKALRLLAQEHVAHTSPPKP